MQKQGGIRNNDVIGLEFHKIYIGNTNYMEVIIRKENPSDYTGITKVNDLAFNQPNEGLLVEKLRKNPEFIPAMSLVAEMDGKIIGHILFFPIRIFGGLVYYKSLSLAPISVLPQHQKMGFGTQLVKHGLIVAKKAGFESVIVLGHPWFYPKFGFVPASRYGIVSPFAAPDEAFMALELVPDALKESSGMVEYPIEFEEFV